MVILSHTRSLTSKPDLGVASALAILYIGVVNVSFTRSPVCVCVCVCGGGGGHISSLREKKMHVTMNNEQVGVTM